MHSRSIEDWTRHGLSDLKLRIARTPLPPRQTFLDDPLRILRCVRFASRFDLAIEPDVSEAIREADIRAALKTKVSKERVGIETTKMLQKAPLRAMELIEGLGLHSSIFVVPDQDVSPPHSRAQGLAATQILTEVLKREGRFKGSEALWLAAAVCPFRGAAAMEKKKESTAVAVIIGDGLKLSNELKIAVANLFDAATLLDPRMEGRARIGTTLQNPSVKPWESSLVWAVVDRILPSWTGSWGPEHDAILAEWTAFYDKIVALGLPESIKQPPLVNVSFNTGVADSRARRCRRSSASRPGRLSWSSSAQSTGGSSTIPRRARTTPRPGSRSSGPARRGPSGRPTCPRRSSRRKRRAQSANRGTRRAAEPSASA